jgi:hypothetical protein
MKCVEERFCLRFPLGGISRGPYCLQVALKSSLSFLDHILKPILDFLLLAVLPFLVWLVLGGEHRARRWEVRVSARGRRSLRGVGRHRTSRKSRASGLESTAQEGTLRWRVANSMRSVENGNLGKQAISRKVHSATLSTQLIVAG